MNTKKQLIEEIVAECFHLREGHKILSEYEKVRRIRNIRKTGEVLEDTAEFWRQTLRALLDSVAIKISILLGAKDVMGYEQVCFDAFYSRMTSAELAKCPREDFERLLKKYADIIKSWNSYRNSYAAHKDLDKILTFSEYGLDVCSTEQLIEETFRLAKKYTRRFMKLV